MIWKQELTYWVLNFLVGIWLLPLWSLPRFLREELAILFTQARDSFFFFGSFIAIINLFSVYVLKISSLSIILLFSKSGFIFLSSSYTHTHVSHTYTRGKLVQRRHFSLFGLLLYLLYFTLCLAHRVCVE